MSDCNAPSSNEGFLTLRRAGIKHCPVCGHDSWCMVSRRGDAVLCMRVIDSPDGKARELSDGTPYGLHSATDAPLSHAEGYERAARAMTACEVAPVETRHAVYSALLDALALSPAHRAALALRGLSSAAIDARGYRTLPPPSARKRVVAQVRATLSAVSIDSIPGLYKGKLSGAEGLLIPVRDTEGRIVACKVRVDSPGDGGKYRWLSSAHDDGPGPGAPCHVPLVPASEGLSDNALSDSYAGLIRVTEGPLKADVATHQSGILTLGVASCTAARTAVDVLRALNARVVRVALDADFRSNPHVARGLALAVKVYRDAGYEVEIETWDGAIAKGIDDALVAGVALSVHRGADVDRVTGQSTAQSTGQGTQGAAHGASHALAKVTEVSRGKAQGEAARGASDAHASAGIAFERGDAVELAHALLSAMRAEAQSSDPDAVVYDRGAFYVYAPSKGIYEEHTRASLYARVAAYAGAPVGPKDKPLSLFDGAIKGVLYAASQLCERPGFFADAPRGVTFANAFVTVRAGEVVALPHAPEHRSTHAIPCDYTGAPTDDEIRVWLGTMREVFRRPVEDDKGNVVAIDETDTELCVSLFQEFAGASLMGYAASYAACLVLHGTGNDGKSTLLAVLRALFPSSAVCSIPPQSWSRGFLLAGLAGKRLNVVSELPSHDLMDSERFKSVVAGDPLTAERKHQDPFTLLCDAGHIFAANELLSTRDQTLGFWRRFIVIPCVRQFGPDEVIRDLHKKIVASELAAIAAWAIEGAARLQRQGAYTSPASAKAAKADWQRDSDQVRQWVEDCCAELPKGAPREQESVIDALYPCYRLWSLQTGHTPIARNKLAQRLKGLGLAHHTAAARLYRLAINARWAQIMESRDGREGHAQNDLTPRRKPVYGNN